MRRMALDWTLSRRQRVDFGSTISKDDVAPGVDLLDTPL